MVSNIVFWQNFPNHLQSSLICSLADRNHQLSVTLVCQNDLPAWRRNMGWQPPDFGEARLITAPDQSFQKELLLGQQESTVHIFSGTRGYPFVWDALQKALETKARIGIYSEAQDWRGMKGVARRARAYFDARRLRHRVNFILAIGHLGIHWYTKCGYPLNKIYPFGYFVAQPTMASTISTPIDDTTIRLLMIGQCVYRKGIDVLLHALSGLRSYNWRLEIIGDGVDRPRFEGLTQGLALADKVIFRGVMPHAEAMSVLAQSDLLVLPSRWDGWGAVVNEALMRGIPAMCSDHCGAADLLGSSEHGEVFPSGAMKVLQSQLMNFFSQEKRSLRQKQDLIEWSNVITGETASRYLLEVIKTNASDGRKPVAPWLVNNGVSS